jgi:DNA polymerase III subunit epsilon
MPFFRRQKNLPDYVQNYLDAPRPKGNIPWREAPYSVLDVETNGLNHKRHSLLAIGVLDIDQGRIQINRRWYTNIRPPDTDEVGADTIRIHGLLRRDLEDAPALEEVLPELLQRLQGRVLVVHIAAIDVKFLDQALRTHYGVKLRGPAIDTARLGGVLLQQEHMLSGTYDQQGPRDTTLRSLAASANVPVEAQHNALSDALTTAQLFLSQATKLQKRGHDTFHKLLRVGGCLK